MTESKIRYHFDSRGHFSLQIRIPVDTPLRLGVAQTSTMPTSM